MKLITISSIALAVLVIAACHSHKKSTTTVAASEAPTNTSATKGSTSDGPVFAASKNTGIYSPGEAELEAIQAKFKEVTMQTLNDGHAIYTGACASCHRAKSIYDIPEKKWSAIMDDMAPRARITATQKDAVYKYVLAIKATQPY